MEAVLAETEDNPFRINEKEFSPEQIRGFASDVLEYANTLAETDNLDGHLDLVFNPDGKPSEHVVGCIHARVSTPVGELFGINALLIGNSAVRRKLFDCVVALFEPGIVGAGKVRVVPKDDFKVWKVLRADPSDDSR